MIFILYLYEASNLLNIIAGSLLYISKLKGCEMVVWLYVGVFLNLNTVQEVKFYWICLLSWRSLISRDQLLNMHTVERFVKHGYSDKKLILWSLMNINIIDL